MAYKNPEDERTYQREYRRRPHVKAKQMVYMREYNQRPEVIERRRKWQRAKYHKRKKTNDTT